MPYSDFTLLSAEHVFALRRTETRTLFVDIPPCAQTPWLDHALAEGVPLAMALNTEKARSEFLIVPVLLDVRRLFPGQASLFSGVLFDVDPARGLTGYADFLLSRSGSQLVLTAPVVVVVEAKNDNLSSGLGQCLATMVAARCFNTRAQTGVTTILGTVTTGIRWQFLRLDGDDVAIEIRQYDVERDVTLILGILAARPIQIRDALPAGFAYGYVANFAKDSRRSSAVASNACTAASQWCSAIGGGCPGSHRVVQV